MRNELTFGEYLRRLRRSKRWQLGDVAEAAGLSATHLSRLENDNALPNADTVVKLAAALDGELTQMLELAQCLPREILERLTDRLDETPEQLRRAAGGRADPWFAKALIRDLDPSVRRGLARFLDVDERDVDGIVDVLKAIGRMPERQRSALAKYIADLVEEEHA